MIRKIHAYLVKEVNPAENAEQSVPSYLGSFLDPDSEGGKRLWPD